MLLLLAALAAAPSSLSPTPPPQPKTGPGGAEVSHQGVTAKLYGSGARAYWLFEPAAPRPAQAPLLVFLHGWSGMQPRIYGAWIEHLVKRGSIVVFPLYQDSLRTPVAEFTPNAAAAVKDAIHRLQTEPGHVQPRLDKFALAGHSMGGVVAANLAARWEADGLPRPRAIMAVQPGKTWAQSKAVAVQLEDLSRIPAGTLLLAVTGDRDTLARDVDAKRIFRESTRIPFQDKNYVTLVSDGHGQPALTADHFAPVAPDAALAPDTPDTSPNGRGAETGPFRRRLRERLQERRAERSDGAAASRGVDALDWYGTWKLLDGLTDAAFFGKNRRYALGNTPEQRFMGRWSDGVAVKELLVTDKP